MWVEKEIHCGALIPLKVTLVGDFIKICNLKVRIESIIILVSERCAFAAAPQGHLERS